ncbi:MAG: ATP-dependent RecD-like DNA helicase [Chroococcidiopsis sp. SAG 2025]|uniref:helix-hairpin-helix domain-containing protein n=1 Tax=Chroococcidiopsis sp. SAG 2025 TaxID=171389 RepID=UPI0029373C87|nr:helix-hairpin-helix domain-containing protein [Chroococcidiopsis sp. SAG 2025]MDV2994625.1 ATP-dependent RecD-like DNA helicase [Chroococcidiopsis sp. SAG 2025]
MPSCIDLKWVLYGIGFITADVIARNLCIAPDSEYRYRAGIVHVLGEAAEDGHCFLPQAELVEQVVKRLSIKDHQPNSGAIAKLLVQMGMSEKNQTWGEVKRLSIDEISQHKRHQDFVTVVSDIDRGKLLEVIDSHRQKDIIQALKQQPLEVREQVEEVSVDM